MILSELITVWVSTVISKVSFPEMSMSPLTAFSIAFLSPVLHEVINIDVANNICKLMKVNPIETIVYSKDRPFNDQRYAVSTKRINYYGWKPIDSLEVELPKIIKWYKNNYNYFKKK